MIKTPMWLKVVVCLGTLLSINIHTSWLGGICFGLVAYDIFDRFFNPDTWKETK